MFNLIRNVANLASEENYQTVVNAYNRVTQAVTPSTVKVEKMNASKLNSLAKCDDSMLFSLYSERCNKPTFFVIYVPRLLLVYRSSDKSNADAIRLAFSSLVKLINLLGTLMSLLIILTVNFSRSYLSALAHIDYFEHAIE
ncbi:hypothetical protein Tcan_02272 [Toxocara canis]|uniref:Uncharacterized protein n=1 Tax=Toxocara canis TaxID=6265 RepID=A0A0B2UQC1_TOXCA|nr:hypothetical protein Tcan_02272 [Toxocara canis]